MPTCSIWVHGGALGHGGIRRCEAVVAALSNMDRESVIALFRNLENPRAHARFFEQRSLVSTASCPAAST
jgi:hypothetical protein